MLWRRHATHVTGRCAEMREDRGKSANVEDVNKQVWRVQVQEPNGITRIRKREEQKSLKSAVAMLLH